MSKFEITKQQQKELAAYPNLNKYVASYIKNNGRSEKPGCISDLVYFFKMMCLNNNLNEEELFSWDEETATDFYTWGSNSRWANTFDSYLDSNFVICINIALDLVKQYGDIDLEKVE